MGETTGIEWADATWNPVTGCTRISAGCANCYALAYLHRYRKEEGIQLHYKKLRTPTEWKKPKKVFVCSLADLFHKDVPNDFRMLMYDVMTREAPQHTYQVLTKRPTEMMEFKSRYGPALNVWHGVTIENRGEEWREVMLGTIQSRVRFLSCEPLLGPLNLLLKGINWVIVGGESGPKARPMDPDWVRDIRDQCVAAKVPFFFKQWGGRKRKEAGRELDGRTWEEMPV